MFIAFWLEIIKEKGHLELGVDGRIILKRFSTKHDSRLWTVFIWLSTTKVACSCKNTKEFTGSTTCSEFDQMRNH
jgi:hypothetical protein